MAALAALAVSAALNSPAAAAAPWCAVDSLTLNTVGPISGGEEPQVSFEVVLTNTAPEACTLQGYPGVDLVGPDNPTWGPTFSLPRQDGDPQPVTLAPGASAGSLVRFLPEQGGGWVPDTIVVTPPDSTTQLEVPWITGGIAVFRQDGATHPGSYIAPLEPYDY